MRSIFLLVVLIAALCSLSKAGPVVGIDMGANWYKVAMIQGNNLDIVVDDGGNRRRETLMGLRGTDRFFGKDAERVMTRFPSDVYKYSMDLLGKTPEQAEQLGEYHYPYSQKLQSTGDRNTIQIFRGEEEESLLPEEIVAMFLKEAMNIASAKAGIKVVDCVMTVPNFFTHHQRKALLDAAKLAEVNVLAFMNGGIAAGLTYGLNRDKEDAEKNQKVLFYDMGAGNTKVTIVEFKIVDDHKKNKTVPVIQAIGHGWDETLGGREFDLRIANYFARQAEKKVGEGAVFGNKRTMERLLRESRKVKDVLSANQEALISIPDLVIDFDFASSITRADFEKECEDLFDRVKGPIQTALDDSGLSNEDIDLIEVIGGGLRIPKVLQIIGDYVDREVGRHLNGDEAAAFGAAFYAATQSTSFRVKSDIKLKDSTAYGIDVEVVDGVNLGKAGNQALLFKPGNRLGSLKKLSFTLPQERQSHFSLRLVYNSTAPLVSGAPREIAEFLFSGVPLEGDYEYADSPKVTLSFRLSSQGLIEVEKAETEFSILVQEKVSPPKTEEEEGEKAADTKEASGDEGEKNSEDSTASEENKGDAEAEAEAIPSDEEAEQREEKEVGEEEEEEEKAEKFIEVKRNKKVTLKVETKNLGVFPMSSTEIFKSKKKIREMDRADKLKFETEEARNTLETFIYSMRERFYDEDDEIQQFTNEPEKEGIFEALSEVGEWLDDDGEEAPLKDIKEKSKYLHSKTDPVTNRQYEHANREDAYRKFATSYFRGKNETSNITNSHEVEEEEYAEFTQYLANTAAEFRELAQQQSSMPLDEDPLLKIADLEAKAKEIDRKVRMFHIRPKRKPKLPPIVVESEESKTDESEEGGEQPDGGETRQEDEKEIKREEPTQENQPDEL